MNDRRLEVFLTTAECGSFNKAAHKLYIAPQSLIKQINHLEEEIGVKLFRRTHKGLTLTSAGEVMRSGAEKILRISEETYSRCREAALKDNRLIRLGVVPSISFSTLPTLCARYKDRYPDVTVSYVPLNNSPCSMILDGAIDLFVTVGRRELPDDNLTYYLAMKQLPYIIVLETHRLADRKVVTPEDIENEDVYVDQKSQKYIVQHLKSKSITSEFSDYSVMDTCLRGGVVVTIAALPYYRRPIKFIRLDVPCVIDADFVGLKNPSPAVRDFIDMAPEVYAQLSNTDEKTIAT